MWSRRYLNSPSELNRSQYCRLSAHVMHFDPDHILKPVVSMFLVAQLHAKPSPRAVPHEVAQNYARRGHPEAHLRNDKSSLRCCHRGRH